MNKQQLANKIWASANRMRSKIDANEYKDYILGLIFYKFLSDTEVKCLEKLGVGKEDLPEVKEDKSNHDMAMLIEECQKRIGFFIEYKYLFNTWLEDGDFNVQVLSEALSSFDRLMSANYKSVYDGIFKTLREGLSKLGDNPTSQTKALKDLIRLIKDIPTDGSQDYDVLGYVYEFLISNFAANAGKKAGEFYTPHEVAMIMSEIVAEHHKNKASLEIYDPTSGSGSLLITIGKAVSKHIHGKNKVKYYAQELKENTYNLTRMNLVMRGIIPANIVTRCADTLEEDWPIHEVGVDIDKPLAVDAVVSNPPYSQHWDSKDKELDPRFVNYGLAPKTKADYAFLLHELHHLKPDGILTIVMPHGVLFRGKTPKLYDKDGNLLPAEKREDGQAEGQIRANLIEKNNIDAIIGLPANIFFGTSIPTLIMVLKKNRGNEGILIIDASKGFLKDGKRNKLRACDVKKIADTYRERKTIPGFSRIVTRDEIRRNEYNLNIPRYVDSSDPAEKYDIYATMFGGIPNSEIDDLGRYWEAFPTLKDQVFAKENDRPYSSILGAGIMDIIHNNVDVRSFYKHYEAAFADFKEMMRCRLVQNLLNVKDIQDNDLISANIFTRVADLPLVNEYAAYQILADNWPSIMGDIEIIQTEGYSSCNQVETKYKIKKNKDGIEEEVADGMKGRIMPFDLIQKAFLSEELAEFNSLVEEKEKQESVLGEILDGLDSEEQDALLNDDNTKFDSKSVNKAIDGIFQDLEFKGTKKKKQEAFIKYAFDDDTTEQKLQHVFIASNKISQLKKDIATKEIELEKHTIDKIAALNSEEIADLLERKWIDPIVTSLMAIPDEIIDDFGKKIHGLGTKYATTYNDIESELDKSQTSLNDLINQLTGDEFSIAGLRNIIR